MHIHSMVADITQPYMHFKQTSDIYAEVILHNAIWTREMITRFGQQIGQRCLQQV